MQAAGAEWEQLFGAGLVGGWREWDFDHGMLFGAENMWWGAKKPRRTRHEGLDFARLVFFATSVQAVCLHVRRETPVAGTSIRQDS